MNSKVIVALDRMTLMQASEFVRRTEPLVWGYKVNDLLVEYGAECIGLLKQARAKNIFADPKFLDIPNTVKNGVRRLSNHGADLITVHGIGGMEMIQEATHEACNKIVVVTALTSYNDQSFQLLYNRTRDEYVQLVANLAYSCGAVGCVMSHMDMDVVAHLPKDFKRIIPAIRPDGAVLGDDQRKTTKSPRNADLVVIGRPVTEAENPLAVLMMLNQIME